MICTLMEKLIVINCLVELGNKLRTVIVLEKYAGAGNIYDPVKDKFLSQQPYPSWSLDANDDWQPPMPFPSIINDGQENPEWIYLIEWNDAKYQADNTIGWEATRSNDEAEIKTKYNWNGTTWTSE